MVNEYVGVGLNYARWEISEWVGRHFLLIENSYEILRTKERKRVLTDSLQDKQYLLIWLGYFYDTGRE